MVAGSMILGVGGALLAGTGALVSGLPLAAAAGCYMAGGTASMAGALVLAHLRPGRPQGPPRPDDRARALPRDMPQQAD